MKGHLLLIADGRSPTARSWIENIQELGYRVSLISSFPCEPPANLHAFNILPIAFSRFSQPTTLTSQPTIAENSQPNQRTFIKRFTPHLQTLRYFIGPLTLIHFAPAYKKIIREIAPDLIHALRIPFEGMLGSYTPENIPFLASTWGNDLTLHATGSYLMKKYTKKCLRRADGLIADTRRDLRLGREWGLSAQAPTLTVPGSGGLNMNAIKSAGQFNGAQYNIPNQGGWVVNPRGLRPGSVNQEVFFASIPEILNKHPKTQFICPGLKGNERAQGWLAQFNIKGQTHLLPKLPQSELWSLLKRSQVFVSPSIHDGTPNALLEAMACGCFPVAGDIESLREWIDPGVNGSLIDPHHPHDLAQAVCTALENKNLRNHAATINHQVVLERAAKEATLPAIDVFYHKFLA